MEEESKRTLSFSKFEHENLKFWNKQKIFEKSLERKGPIFSFYDGPPFATGLPHYGHLLAGTIKDAVCRYKTLHGFHVPRRFGWDCHGLPIEAIVEKKEGLSGGASIREFGIAKFNETCRDNVLVYTAQWRAVVTRMARWVDMDHDFKTMDFSFMESVWWVFHELYKRGLVYKGYKVMPFSWKLGTPLSNFEASDNYQSVDDPSLYVAFEDQHESDLYYIAWTTTPWTLLSNMALAVNPTIEYSCVQWENKRYVVATNRLEEVFKGKTPEVIKTLQGEKLVGKIYKPLFNDFESYRAQGAFRIIAADFVTLDGGSGFVHCAPAFGENDFEAAKENGIPMVCPINENGLFTSEVSRYSGRLWRECQKEIIREIKDKGLLFLQETINHRYPFCYRTDTPLIYRATQTWFVAVEKIKHRLLKNNELIHWVPSHIKHGRFGKWLENAKDWAVSRNRFWGTPIPLWESDDGDIICLGSRKELEEMTGVKVDDLHRHKIDGLVIEKEGKLYRRIDAVFDCWFESGSMPYAQNHYPFENKELTETAFPADFIAEGLDQTRGWFYTLHVLATALFDKPAFKNVIVNGIVLAEDGAKMSKRLQNYPDPTELVEKHGADALRLYLLKSPVVRAEDLHFQESGVESVVKQIILPLWNSYTFFKTYADLYSWQLSSAKTLDNEALNLLDTWVLSRLQTLIGQIDTAMASYLLSEAVTAIEHFIEDLTNWYIRRSRRRFWSEDNLSDRNAAMHTLAYVLSTLCKLISPFAPFIAETLYQKLKGVGSPLSVHLCKWPQIALSQKQEELEEVMKAIQTLANLGHGLRKENRLKVRQPLACAYIVDASGKLGPAILKYAHILLDELNVKEIKLKKHSGDLLKVIYKPNFKTLGQRAGKMMRQIQLFMKNFTHEQYQKLKEYGKLLLDLESTSFELFETDILCEHQVLPGQVAAYEGGLAIALDTHLNESLKFEGYARDMINKINTLRKEKGFDISDRISMTLRSNSDILTKVIEGHGSYIQDEVLCQKLDIEPWNDNMATSDIYNADSFLVAFELKKI